MKIIAYSLFKAQRKVGSQIINDFSTFVKCVPMQRKQCDFFYPDFTPVLYVGDNLPDGLIEYLSRFMMIRVEPSTTDYFGLNWRFYPASEVDCELFMSRDLDSMITPREVAAVKEWMSMIEEYPFHVMRDSWHHRYSLMSGLWGAKGKSDQLKFLKEKIILAYDLTYYKQGFENFWDFGSDQRLLNQVVWPLISSKTLAHDEFYYSEFESALIKEFPFHSQSPAAGNDIPNIRNRSDNESVKYCYEKKEKYWIREDGILRQGKDVFAPDLSPWRELLAEVLE